MSISSQMSLIVSQSQDGRPSEVSSHNKSSVKPNGNRQHLTPLETNTVSTDRANGHAARAGGNVLPNGAPVLPAPIFTNATSASPTQSFMDSPTSRLSSEISQSYPPLERPPRKSSSGDDGRLRVPSSHNSTNRRSSPAHTSQLSTSAPTGPASPLRTAPPPLHHRHTLEVPQLNPSRHSEEGVYGRLSPSTPRHRRASLSLGRRVGSRSLQSDLQLDELPQDDDATRWTEAIRAKRASRRRRKEEEDDDRVVVGTKVDQNHVNWVTAYNMLTGIRFTVSRTNAKLDRELTDADFEARHKFSFDITGNEMTPGAKYDFKFKDYAPWVFRHLREIFNIDPADYLISLTSKYILSELGSPGKSGSFFYFSRDYKYIIKTIHHSEHVFLRKILRQYYEHVDKNRNTLLSQFYGLHRVKIPYGKKIHFVVMNNLFPPHRDIHTTFDLKGSTIGREYREEELEKHPRATLKDLNWLRRQLHLEFGPEKKAAFIEQMERDVDLLKRLNIMDYSLLVGIHDLEKGNDEKLRDKTLKVFQPGGEGVEESRLPHSLVRTPSKLENQRKAKELRMMIKNQRPIPMGSGSSAQMPDEMPETMVAGRRHFYFYSDDGGFRATHQDDSPGEAIYYLGIIDCLTSYSLSKKAEHFFKGWAHRGERAGISAVPPDRYGDRFVKFIASTTMPREFGPGEEKKRSEEVHAPSDRTRTTIDSQGPDGATLPVVEEAGETTSVGGRSGQSRERGGGGGGEDEREGGKGEGGGEGEA